MVNIDVLSVANGYFEFLRRSCGTVSMGELKRLCLLPLLKDIVNGRLSFYVTENDEIAINNYIRECFPELLSGDSDFTMTYLIYSGTSDSFPTNNVIKNSSITYASTEERVISPQVVGRYFWIAVPSDITIEKVANRLFKYTPDFKDRSFVGDYIPIDLFETFSTNIDGLNYTVYYTKSTICLNSTYLISFTR